MSWPLTSRSAEQDRVAPDRNLTVETVRGTEAAATAVSSWMGRGDKNGAYRARTSWRMVGHRDPRARIDRVTTSSSRSSDRLGACILLISDRDVEGAIATSWKEADTDVTFGIGGTTQGVMVAAALKDMGGEFQGHHWPRSEEQHAAVTAGGYDLNIVLKWTTW